MAPEDLKAKYDLVDTRAKMPDGERMSKKGEGGEKVKLVANYFRLEKKADFKFLQYRVDFSIDIESTIIKKAVMRRLPSGTLPSYLFDGTILFTREELYPHKEDKFKVYTGSYQTANDQTVPCEIKVKLVGEIHPTDFEHLQVRTWRLFGRVRRQRYASLPYVGAEHDQGQNHGWSKHDTAGPGLLRYGCANQLSRLQTSRVQRLQV